MLICYLLILDLNYFGLSDSPAFYCCLHMLINWSIFSKNYFICQTCVLCLYLALYVKLGFEMFLDC